MILIYIVDQFLTDLVYTQLRQRNNNKKIKHIITVSKWIICLKDRLYNIHTHIHDLETKKKKQTKEKSLWSKINFREVKNH